MDYIKKRDGEDIYEIEYNKYNGYLENFLSNSGLIISNESNNVVFKAVSLTVLNEFLDFSLVENFIYDLGSQILSLKEEGHGVLYIGLSDIVIINSNHFLFINPTVIFPLSLSNNMKISEKIDDEVLGVLKNKIFMASEITSIDSYPSDIYYTSAFYSFATLVLYIFNVKLDSLYYNKVYFFLKRCLEQNPHNRSFVYL